MEKIEQSLSNLTDSDDFQRLSSLKKGFNIFRVLNIRDDIFGIPNFLCWLLNPNEDHLLGDMFFKKLLKKIIRIDNEYLPLLYADISDLEVMRNKYIGDHEVIDIFMESKKNKTVCIIYRNMDSFGCGQPDLYKRYIRENYGDYRHIFLYLTPEKVHKNNTRHKGYIRLDYGMICGIIDEIFKEQDGNMNIYNRITEVNSNIKHKIRLCLTHYKEMMEENIIKNVDYDTAVLCNKICSEHSEALYYIVKYGKEEYMNNTDYAMEDVCKKLYLKYKYLIDDIVKYGKPRSLAIAVLKEVLEESEIFEYIGVFGNNDGDIVCYPCGIYESVKEKLYNTACFPVETFVSSCYYIVFRFYHKGDRGVYFGLFGPSRDEEDQLRKDNFRKSLEKELNIKIEPEKSGCEYCFNEDEPLFSFDFFNSDNKDGTAHLLTAGSRNKDKIKAEMKKRFEEVCVPYIKKFVAALNKADVI